MGFFRQEYWSGLPFPPPGGLPNPGIEPASLVSPVLAGEFFTTEPPGKPFQDLFSQLPSKQHSIVTYSHHIAYYILRTYSSCNWKFVPFVHLQFLRKFPVSVSPTTLIKQDHDPGEQKVKRKRRRKSLIA